MRSRASKPASALAGACGKLLVGVLGLVLSIRFLLRLYGASTRSPPGACYRCVVGIFAVSTLVVSPLLTGSSDKGSKTPGIDQPTGHASHHQK